MVIREKSAEFVQDTDNAKMISMRKRPWELFGFGMQYLWMISVLFTPSVYSFAVVTGWSWMVRSAFLLAIALGYLLFFLLRKHFSGGKMGKGLIIGAGAGGTIATLLVAFPFSPSFAPLTLLVASLLVAVANPVAMLGGNKLWANYRPEHAMMHIAPSVPLAALGALIVLFLPPVLGIVLVSLCPLCGNLILAFSKAGKSRAGSFRKTVFDVRQISRMTFFMACFAFAITCVLGFYMGDVQDGMIVESWKMIILVICAGIAAFVIALRSSEIRFLIMLDRLCVPLAMMGLALLIVLNKDLMWIGVSFIFTGYVFADMFMWLFTADLVVRQQKNAFSTLAKSCAIQWTGLTLGFAVGCAAAGYFTPALALSSTIIVAVCIIVLTLSRLIVFNQHVSVMLIEARTNDDIGNMMEESLAFIAERYALSQRETQVFMMMARGRSVPYIGNTLVLSESTVKTHARNIYRKLGVENRQEFLDTVEKERFPKVL